MTSFGSQCQSGGNPLTDRVCVFVCSSNRTWDVFERVFSRFKVLWPDCPLRCYVGVSRQRTPDPFPGFTLVSADSESGWRAELAIQIGSLAQPIDYVLLLLDDFLLLKKVDTAVILGLCRYAMDNRLPYLRLRPVERSASIALFRRLRSFLRGERVVVLADREPYYSSLQAAIWRRDHLLTCLASPGSIWDFEHLVPPGEHHHAVTESALVYRHVVEKGSWRAYAPRLFAQLGEGFQPGSRPLRPRADLLRFRWERLKFALLGYAGPRVKRRWLQCLADLHRAFQRGS